MDQDVDAHATDISKHYTLDSGLVGFYCYSLQRSRHERCMFVSLILLGTEWETKVCMPRENSRFSCVCCEHHLKLWIDHFFCLFLWDFLPHPAKFMGYFWLWTQKILLAVLRRQYRITGIEPGPATCWKMPFLLSYHSSPKRIYVPFQ